MLVAVLSGANMNFDRLRFVAERAELGEAREALIAVTIPERKGAFREFCGAIGRRVVTEFNYRLSGRQQAHIFVGFATQSRQDADALIAQLRGSGYETVDLTDNEMAKLHVRHMVGGHAPDAQHERLCRFEFPERPGALANFLDALAGRWNISLFHYRNHGSDFGRVLAGLEVEEHDLGAFKSFLEGLGYQVRDRVRQPRLSLLSRLTPNLQLTNSQEAHCRLGFEFGIIKCPNMSQLCSESGTSSQVVESSADSIDTPRTERRTCPVCAHVASAP